MGFVKGPGARGIVRRDRREPTGDPPRTDDETGQGLVTDAAIKRKIRDTMSLRQDRRPRYPSHR
ncbi:hypothetical protein GCM10022225_79960 [Plantactinospora mayteni]|uniref:Uncharacterized protein n=1 Tax=Plantactinospora mayteni TaxID=566021 RepID=A0ABQ4F3A9_9ACTN|nr:type I CRISPR-associated protein Cas7 [Plantactinospora mayteni]GIH01345.1 hypothetical protein Pma05_79170 [Plantactinospora mayteni]